MSDDHDALSSRSVTRERRRQRQVVAWGSGLFLGIGIGAVVGYAVGDSRLGVILAVVLTVITAGIYLGAGYQAAERRAEDIVARDARADDEEEDAIS